MVSIDKTRENHRPAASHWQTLLRKGQKDKQRSTNHTYTTKDRVTRTPLKFGSELPFPLVLHMLSSSFSNNCF
jgi:hypothetical protein